MRRTVRWALKIVALLVLTVVLVLVVLARLGARDPSEPAVMGRWRELRPPDFE